MGRRERQRVGAEVFGRHDDSDLGGGPSVRHRPQHVLVAVQFPGDDVLAAEPGELDGDGAGRLIQLGARRRVSGEGFLGRDESWADHFGDPRDIGVYVHPAPPVAVGVGLELLRRQRRVVHPPPAFGAGRVRRREVRRCRGQQVVQRDAAGQDVVDAVFRLVSGGAREVNHLGVGVAAARREVLVQLPRLTGDSGVGFDVAVQRDIERPVADVDRVPFRILVPVADADHPDHQEASLRLDRVHQGAEPVAGGVNVFAGVDHQVVGVNTRLDQEGRRQRERLNESFGQRDRRRGR